MQTLYYYGLKAAIKDMFLDPSFCEERKNALAEGTGALRKFPEFERINEACGGLLNNHDNGMIDIGADAFQPFRFVTHSTQLVVAR